METKSFRASLLAGALAMTGFAASTFAAEGYVVNGTGQVVRDSLGQCVRTPSWSPANAIAQCDPNVVVGFMAVQVPEPQPEAAAPQMRLITLDTDTTFGFDSSELSQEGKNKLNEIVAASEGTERMQIRIAGYTDRIGTEAYNEELSRRRAEAVRDYLVAGGIPEASIAVAARGESDPVVQCEGLSGDTLIECLRPNRRSEVEFAALETVPAEEPQSDMQRSPESTMPEQPGTLNPSK